MSKRSGDPVFAGLCVFGDDNPKDLRTIPEEQKIKIDKKESILNQKREKFFNFAL